MAKSTEWAGKVLALLKSGNAPAALAQIKVAPSVKDLKALRQARAEASAKAGAGAPAGALKADARRGQSQVECDIDTAIEDNIAALSSPRLHRSP